MMKLCTITAATTRLRPSLFWPILLLACAGVQALEPGIALEGLTLQPLVEQTEFRSADRDATFDNIREDGGFQPLHRADINQGISGRAFWLRTRLVNNRDNPAPWILVHQTSYLDHIELYTRDKSEREFKRTHLSDRVPFDERPIDYRTLAFSGQTPGESYTDIYLKVYYDKPDSVSLEFTLYSPEAFAQAVQRENLWFGAYYGALAVMLFLALIIGVLLRRPSVFIYAALLLATGWKWTLLNGFGFQYLWPNSIYGHNEGFHIAFLLFAICATQFSKSFLNTRIHFPLGHRLLQVIQFVALAGIAVRLMGAYEPALHIAFITLAVIALTLPIIGAHAWYNGLRYARWYFLAWLIYSVSLLLTLASAYLNIVPNGMYALTLLQVGSLLEAVFLTVALTERLLNLETERRNALALANQDPLTGLGNRRLLQSEYERFINSDTAQRKPMYLIMIDLDHFKQINDHYGHDAGDQVLKEVARLLRAHCRDTDVCIRYGGEEFALLVRTDTVQSARAIAERVREEFAGTPTLYDGQSIAHTLSCGITPVQRHGQALSVNEMMKYADQALYEGKAAGRNCTVIYRDSLSNPALQTIQ